MIVIPMAGKSSRFYKTGYTVPKYELLLKDKYLFDWSILSFGNYFQQEHFVFIVRLDNNAKRFVSERCKVLGIKKFDIVTLDKDTDGQAETVCLGLEAVNAKNNECILIFNIDTIRFNFQLPEIHFDNRIEGYLEVFEGNGDHWSFIEPKGNRLVKRTTEKVRISNYCSTGLYVFKCYEYFKKALNIEKKSIQWQSSELYVAPLYNHLISEKANNIGYYKINESEVLFSGTPKEYENLNKSVNEIFN